MRLSPCPRSPPPRRDSQEVAREFVGADASEVRDAVEVAEELEGAERHGRSCVGGVKR
jgi:hypothetical protein